MKWPWVSRKKAEARQTAALNELKVELNNHLIRAVYDERAKAAKLGKAIASFKVLNKVHRDRSGMPDLDRRYYQIIACVEMGILVRAVRGMHDPDYIRVLLESNFARLIHDVMKDAQSIVAEKTWKEE
jgi:hypothetical protein